jgi:coenzyme F420-reducing hydrogenase beta subunit
VGWSNDEKTRARSASGGIAAEIYKYAINHDFFSAGVEWKRDSGASFIPIKTLSDIERIQNSKYVYSNTNGIYKKYQSALKSGRQAVFIGLPCQVAALKNYLGKEYDNLITIDIICHGVAPGEYLMQHLSFIEKKKKQKTDRLYFRDPAFLTCSYTFTLYNDQNLFWKKTAYSNDVYQHGFHKSLIFNNNCYLCQYACPNRVGDITLGDFAGLGKLDYFEFSRQNVSCILCNTDKGLQFLESIKDDVCLLERPINEALDYEIQLKHPSIPHRKRKSFVESFIKTNNFERSARKALRRDILRVQARKWIYVLFLRFIPVSFKVYVKNMLHGTRK